MRRCLSPTALALVLTLALTGCGVFDRGSDVPDDVPESGRTDAFRLVPEGSRQRVVGHGISFLVPADWKQSQPEEVVDDSAEWAVEAPAPDDPYVPYVSISAGVEEKQNNTVESLVGAVKGIQSINKSYEALGEGKIDVPGAKQAYQLHFRYDDELAAGADGTKTKVRTQTRMVFLGLPGGQVTTVRFIAPAPHWGEGRFDEVQSSLAVRQRGE